MRRVKHSIAIGMIILLGTISTEIKANEKIDKKIQAKEYVINVTNINPTGANTIFPNAVYKLTLKNDSVFSNLPYFGRAYRAPGDQSTGLSMETNITEYKVTEKKKGTKLVTFKAITKDDTYIYRITIYEDGTSKINVSMNNRQPINFDGNIEM